MAFFFQLCSDIYVTLLGQHWIETTYFIWKGALIAHTIFPMTCGLLSKHDQENITVGVFHIYVWNVLSENDHVAVEGVCWAGQCWSQFCSCFISRVSYCTWTLPTFRFDEQLLRGKEPTNYYELLQTFKIYFKTGTMAIGFFIYFTMQITKK